MRLSGWPTTGSAPQRRAPSREEQQMQRAIIDWCRYAVSWRGRAITEWLHFVPNGAHLGKSAGIYRSIGLLAGVPDLCLPVPSGGFGALYIELKRARGKPPSDVQLDRHARFREAGNRVLVCRSAREACAAIVEHLQGAGGELEVRARVEDLP